MLTFAICVASVALLQAPETQLAQTEVDIKWDALKPSKVVVQVPLPITFREFDRYVEILHLSEEQRHYFDREYDDYKDRCRLLERELAPFLLQQSDVIASRTAPAGTFDQTFEDWRRAEERFCDSLAQEDRRLFTILSVVLADSQLPLLERVEWHRERAKCLRKYYKLLKAQIDLSRMIETAEFPPEIKQHVDSVMMEYEAAVTPALVRADRLYRDNRALKTRLSEQTRYGDDGQPLNPAALATQERIATLAQRRRAASASEGSAWKRVAEINDKFLPRFLEMLPPEFARVFEEAYQRKAYPRAYPDPTSVQLLYQELTRNPVLTDDFRMILEQQWTVHQSQYADLCRQLEEASQRWQEQYAFTETTEGWEEHNRRIEGWRAERVAANEEFVRRIEAILPTEIATAMKTSFDAWRANVAALRAYEKQYPKTYIDPR